MENEERNETRGEYIMSVLIELYEDQMGAKYDWTKIETEDKTA